jgi:peptidoglycan hydrolase-like protein with peptidoglycan-binding domain
MDSKFLTESGWKTVAQKSKLKDKDLQQALFFYETLEEDDHEMLLKSLTKISTLAGSLKRSKELAESKEVTKYLGDVAAAAEAEKNNVAKAKAQSAKMEAMTLKKAEAAAKQRGAEEEGEEEEEEGEYADLLLKAFQKLKGAKDVVYEFIVCDAKPHCGVMIAKRITPKHKETLTKVTGSKRFLHTGTCQFQDGRFVFGMEQPVSGLARKLQESIKNYVGKKLPIMVGNESVEEGEEKPQAERDKGKAAASGAPKEEPPLNLKAPFAISGSVGRGGKNKPQDVQAVQAALNTRAKAGLVVDGKCGPKTIAAIMAFQKTLGQAKPDGLVEVGRGTARALSGAANPGPPPAVPEPVAPPKLGKPALAKAPEVWHGTREIVDKNIEALQKAVRAQYAHEHPDLLKEIDENLQKLDGILDKLDHRLADSLAKAHAAANDAARKAELAVSKGLLAEYIKYVKSEPLIAHIDSNPFGVATNLKKVLTDSLTHMAQSIG